MLVMFMHAIVRIEQNFFIASAVGAWYVLTRGPAARKPWHLFVCILAILCLCSDATFADLPFGLGTTGLTLSDKSKNAIIVPFVPVWGLVAVLNGYAFFTASDDA